MKFDSIKIGSQIGPLKSASIDKEQIKFYAKVSKDFNSIHTNNVDAKNIGFKREIVQGMLIMGIIYSMLLSYIDEDIVVKNYALRFLSPLYINDELVVTFRTVEVDINNIRFEIDAKFRERKISLGNVDIAKIILI